MHGLSLLWALPFAGLLLSIALMPLFFGAFWGRNFGKICAFWTSMVVIPMLFNIGIGAMAEHLFAMFFHEYLPFLVLIAALFTTAGGIVLRGTIAPSTKSNLIFLAAGGILASFMGTTGAAMTLIRPLIRTNSGRKYNAHTVVFFIFIVANVGGLLTPLGDPPLFIGYLLGVDFLWTLEHLWQQWLLMMVGLLLAYGVIDFYFQKNEAPRVASGETKTKLKLVGAFNICLMFIILLVVWGSSQIDTLPKMTIFSTEISLIHLIRDGILVAVMAASHFMTPKTYHKENGFHYEPIIEVAILFLAIFITLLPLAAILHDGYQGSLAGLFHLLEHPDGQKNALAYYLLTGFLSGFLDNAPTYLVFFNRRGRRCRAINDQRRRDIGGSVDGCGIYGCAYLYWQCAQYDGQGHCPAPPCPHA